MRLVKFKAIDELGAWVFGIPNTITTLNSNLEIMSQYFTEQRKYSRQNVSIKPETLCEFTGLEDVKGVEIYENDLLLDRAYDKEAPNGEYYESKLPIFFENGAFWVDKSFSKDRSSSVLLAEFDKPLICGNIYNNAQG